MKSGTKNEGPAGRPSVAAPFFKRLAAFQRERPWLVLLLTTLITALALSRAAKLELLTGFEHLLPQNRASVKELHRVAGKTAGVSTLFIVLHAGEGPQGPAPKEALRKAGDALVTALDKLGPPVIGSVEDGVQEAVRSMAPRAGLYADLPALERLRDDLNARFEYEVGKQMGTALDPSEPPPPEINAEELKKRFGSGVKQAEEFPDGYYQSADGKVVVVAARSKVLGSDLAKGQDALRRVREVIDQVNLASYHPSIRYGLAGDLYSGVAEVSAINEDLTQVGVTGILLIGGIVFLYYLRVRTLLVMLLTILVGVAWTFGVTQATIGHLNLATGFLVTIVAGNGINAGIIYMARYLEARREHLPLGEAIELAHQETWLATLTACAAASASYASLGITEFRGFRDFGLIGGAGMLLCWIATYFAMPSLLVLMERLSPLDSTATGGFARFRWGWGGAFGRPFAALVPLAPRFITVAGLALAAVGTIALVRYIQQDPMEYDMKNLRNDLKAREEESYNKRLADEITHYVGSDAMAILVDRPEQVAPLRAALHAVRDAAPEGKKPFKDLHALEDFVPDQQAEKIPVLLEIKDKILRAHRRKLIAEEDWRRLEAYLPPDDLRPGRGFGPDVHRIGFDIPDLALIFGQSVRLDLGLDGGFGFDACAGLCLAGNRFVAKGFQGEDRVRDSLDDLTHRFDNKVGFDRFGKRWRWFRGRWKVRLGSSFGDIDECPFSGFICRRLFGPGFGPDLVQPTLGGGLCQTGAQLAVILTKGFQGKAHGDNQENR